MKVKLAKAQDQIQAADNNWLTLGELRKVVHEADQNDWSDSCLVSHSVGREHPTLRHTQIATRLIVEGPS